jgi:carbon storage regulator
MLVLSRRIGEELIIGGNVTIRVVNVQGSKVRLAIAAPSDVAVDRAEVHERRSQFNQALHDMAKSSESSLTCASL